jgi:hypothetical protein
MYMDMDMDGLVPAARHMGVGRRVGGRHRRCCRLPTRMAIDADTVALACLGWTSSPHRCASGVTKLSATEHLARCVLLPTGSVTQMVMSWCLTCSLWSQPFWFHVIWLA